MMKKIVVVGDTSVGKTSLVSKYVDDYYPGDHLTTIGVDFKLKKVQKNGRKIDLTIWDTGGQERFKSITKSYFKGAHAVILVYACNCEESFANIIDWLLTIENCAEENVVKIMVANKSDVEELIVSHEKGRAFAEEHGCFFYPCSSVTGKNIDKIFNKIIDELRETDTTKACTIAKSSFLLDSNPGLATHKKKKRRRCRFFKIFRKKKPTEGDE
ncbi:unnamed protein product [Moneuplotes crassus]|uniref:Uncharacterized protein n=1 Tax=Euplotes crassus TaxID=5936 RepID=A0AAD1XUL6_EUPCR|nr:unnamed protein product [Moneuplotes crassus]